jgi:hypothetical protein
MRNLTNLDIRLHDPEHKAVLSSIDYYRSIVLKVRDLCNGSESSLGIVVNLVPNSKAHLNE